MDDKVFTSYVEKIRDAFPRWSKIHKDPEAIGSQFLAVLGMPIDEVESILNYAYQQQYIGGADLEQADILYRAKFPQQLTSDTNFRVNGESHALTYVNDPVAFLTHEDLAGEPLNALYQKDLVYIDFEEKYLYTYKPYQVTEDQPEGCVTLKVLSAEGDLLNQEVLPLKVHHVWNFFDEFGLLLHTPRLYKERNLAYKQRLLDVFKRPANSTYQGLLNGLSRDLGLVKQVTWTEPHQVLALKEPRIDKTSITIDGEPFPLELITTDENNHIILQSDNNDADLPPVVRYQLGVSLHTLHDKSDHAFQQELFSLDGHATSLLQYYVNHITNHVPIMWGQWRWEQGFWDTAEDTQGGQGYLPSFHDARISEWKTYTE